jgi:adenylate kinase family enzyme
MAAPNISLTRPHIGLVGGIASGKGTICDILAGIGYTIIALSDFIAEEIRAKQVTNIDRRTYFETANEMRREEGNDVLCRLAISYITRNNINPFVIDGLRTVDEVQLMRRTFDDFFLIGINVPIEKRIERVLDPLFRTVYRLLHSHGEFIFSFDHPVLYATYQAYQKRERRKSMATFDYLNERVIRWTFRTRGAAVPAYSYHRRIGTILNALIESGFKIQRVIEPSPSIRSVGGYRRAYRLAKRLPYTLIIKAEKI